MVELDDDRSSIMWLIGLLNPVAAFIKACKAIYDIVKFFIDRAEQVGELVNAIVDSVGALAGGALGEAAGKVENALAKGIPVAIGFLASLLGLGGISDKIKSIIHAIQEPIHNIIGKVLGVVLKPFKWIGNKIKQGAAWAKKKLTQGVAAVKGKVKGLFGRPDQRTPEQKQLALNEALADSSRLLRRQDLSTSQIKGALPAIKSKHALTSIRLVVRQQRDEQIMHVEAKVNPEGKTEDENKKQDWVAKNVVGDARKFSAYVLDPDHPVGGTKAKIFIDSLGYGPKSQADGDQLLALYVAQAKEKFANKDYEVGKSDQWGQRFTIVIAVTGKGDKAAKTMNVESGWILRENGDLELATPFAGFRD